MYGFVESYEDSNLNNYADLNSNELVFQNPDNRNLKTGLSEVS